MRRPWQIWLAFGICLAAVFLATAWLSYKALQSDRAEQLARNQAALEENARLALWRMDSYMAPLVAQENAELSTPFRGDPKHPPNPFADPVDQQATWPAPWRLVSTYFQLAPDGTVTLQPADGARVVEDLRHSLATLSGRLPSMPAAPPAIAQDDPFGPPDLSSQQTAPQQSDRGQAEYQARKRSVEMTNIQQQSNAVFKQSPSFAVAANSPLDAEMSTPLWLSNQLVLARRVEVDGRNVIQGCVLDWPRLKDQLLPSIVDLLPHAQLIPADNPQAAAEVRLMASLPVELVPGQLGAPGEAGLSPIQLSLLVTWSALALATAAVAVLLNGVIALSERRAAFVSAVTHELRTPLTTFRMYAEMLSEGMVTDEADRRKYLETLRIEADRLTHLVANVLAYARLERGRTGGRLETISVDRLLEAASGRLVDRARQANLNLSTEVDAEVGKSVVKADPSAVEQILFNLVDNACKYAAGATDRTLALSAAQKNGAVELRVCDHGPGLSAVEQRRLFQPFRKSARDAANSAPGVGLGLALSRRLAREMGGNLRYDAQPTGACFVLSLPSAS